MSTKRSPTADSKAAMAMAGAKVKVGFLAAGSKVGAMVVDFEGNTAGPVAARSVMAMDEAAILEAVTSRLGAVLLFENEDPRLPIIVGMLAPDPGAALLGSLLRAPATAPTPAPQAATSPGPTRQLEARVDGRRVVLEGDQEVVLRCGEASITLRRDGKVVVRGAYIETTAKGLNRIRGGSVKIN